VKEKLKKLHKWLSSDKGKAAIKKSQEETAAALKEMHDSMEVTPEKMQERFTI